MAILMVFRVCEYLPKMSLKMFLVVGISLKTFGPLLLESQSRAHLLTMW